MRKAADYTVLGRPTEDKENRPTPHQSSHPEQPRYMPQKDVGWGHRSLVPAESTTASLLSCTLCDALPQSTTRSWQARHSYWILDL